MHLDKDLQQRLQQRRQQQRYRQRYVMDSVQGAQVSVKGRACLNFSSNDYLGLAAHPEVIAAMQSAVASAGVGSGASHLVCGHHHYHQQLETALAAFSGRERALLFSSGYMANMGVITALMGAGDTVFEDRLNHASLLDGGLLSGARFRRFQHNNCQQLAARLDRVEQGRKLVVVDGVFSMDGDLAPLPELARLCHQHQAYLMVDDAHGFGVLGAQGGGSAEHWQLCPQQLPIVVGTLGKAFGTFGAFVAGSATLIEALIQFARSYIYTTALPPAIAAASLCSLALLRQGDGRRQRLQQRIDEFRTGAQRLGLPLMLSPTPIQPLVLGDDKQVLAVAQALSARDILVGAIRPPTVPQGSARLRITLSAAHSADDVDRLLLALDQLVPLSMRLES
ncbi:MAG: 8-amino-7-oxononanoate synthase [Cellvibrionaceae bacterium]|nr:8-amino-7-oxononanoate synthase [Cellvibrionaceae bacterium]